MNASKTFVTVAILTITLLSGKIMHAQDEPFVFNPLLTEKEQDVVKPFSYFLKQSDELGFKDAPKGVQITYDGAYNTKFGEFTLSAGTPLKPLNSRLRTLSKGYLPIINYAVLCDEIEYRVQSFACPVNHDPLENLITFVRVTAHNAGKTTRRGALGGRFFDHEGPWRHPLFDKRKPWGWIDKFTNREKWVPWKEWEPVTIKAYSQVHRSGHLIFTYTPESKNWSVFEPANNIEPVEFSMNLKPGQSASVVFKFPYAPVEESRAEHLQNIIAADYDRYLEKTTAFWNRELDAAAVFSVPEEKVVNMHKASLIYDLIARNVEEDRKTYVQTVSAVQYNDFFSRDAAFIIHTYDLLGRSKLAEECIDYILLKDATGALNGFRTTHPDAWGQVLWTVAAHYRMTGDKKFAEKVYPAIPPHPQPESLAPPRLFDALRPRSVVPHPPLSSSAEVRRAHRHALLWESPAGHQRPEYAGRFFACPDREPLLYRSVEQGL